LCLILNSVESGAQWFVGLDEARILKKKKVDTPDELLTLILVAAARLKQREGQIRLTTCDLLTRVKGH